MSNKNQGSLKLLQPSSLGCEAEEKLSQALSICPPKVGKLCQGRLGFGDVFAGDTVTHTMVFLAISIYVLIDFELYFFGPQRLIVGVGDSFGSSAG